jgi:hypothetical protein
MSRLHNPGHWTPWLGVFVPHDERTFVPGLSFVFTATESDNEFIQRDSGKSIRDGEMKMRRKNMRLSSFEVSFTSAGRRIVPKRWLNGLWFFNNTYHQRDLVVPWPSWMY